MVVIFLNFISSVLLAAPTAPNIDIQNGTSVESQDSKSEPSQINPKLETLSPNKVQSNPAQADNIEEYRTYFYKYDESLSLRLGGNHDFGDPPDEEDDNTSAQFGFAYMFESQSKAHLEFAADLFPKREEFFLQLALKVVELSTEAFRPHYKIGGAIKFDSGDKFNTPLKTENYFGVLGVGFEDIIKDPLSLRIDMDLLMSSDNALFVLSAGISYGF